MDVTTAKDWLQSHDIKSFEIIDVKTGTTESLIDYILENVDQDFKQLLENLDSMTLEKIPALIIAILLYNSRIAKNYAPKDLYIDLKSYFKSQKDFVKLITQFPELQFLEPNPNNINSEYYKINPRDIPIQSAEGETNLYDLISSFPDLEQLVSLLTDGGIPKEIVLFIWYDIYQEIPDSYLKKSRKQFILDYDVYIAQFQGTSSTPTEQKTNYYTINPREIPIRLATGNTNLYDLISRYANVSEILEVLQSIGISIRLILLIWYSSHNQITPLILQNWSSESEFLSEYNTYIRQFQEGISPLEETDFLQLISSEQKGRKLEPNVFDSEITLSYRYAGLYNIPTRFIFKIQDTYYSMYELFSRIGGSLEHIYSVVSKITPDISNIDVAYMYLQNKIYKPQLALNDEVTSEINAFLGTDYVIPELEQNYGQWLNRLGVELQETQRIFNTIDTIQKTLLQITPTTTQSAFKLNEITMIFSPLSQNTKVPIAPIDGLNIFNNAMLNSLIPYMTYNDGTRKITKIYTGKIFENGVMVREKPNYDFIIPDYTLMNEASNLYFQFWMDQKGEPGKTSYRLIKYDLAKNEFIVPFKDNLVKSQKLDIQEKIRPLAEIFPNLYFKAPTIKNIEGEVDIYNEIFGVEINIASFLHLVLLDPLFNTYLYVSEVSDSAGHQKSLVLRYNSYLEREIKVEKSVASNLTATIIQEKAKRGTSYMIVDKDLHQVRKIFEFDMPYIKLEIKNAKNSSIINQFLDVFQRLLQTYFEKRSSIESLYTKILGSPNSGSANSSRSQSISSLNTSMGSMRIASSRPSMTSTGERDRLRELQQYRVFKEASNYARYGCQKKLLPIVIQPEEKEAWEKKTYPDKAGSPVNLKVLEFHVKDERGENQLLLMGCDPETYDSAGNRKPEPYFKENKYTSNKAEYPYLPCCGSKRHQYTSNLELTPSKQVVSTDANKIKSSGAVEIGTYANISLLLERFLKTFDSNSKSIKRRGVIDDSNNLIHCLLSATDNSYNTISQVDKIIIATQKRIEILQKYSPILCKAELYDYTEEEISNSLQNDKLDPRLHYRILEEAFNVNIWTFYERAPNFQTLLIPRHKLFHIRTFNSRNNVILFRSESNALNFSTSLITDYRDTEVYTVFGKNMGTILYKLFLALHSHNLTLITENIQTYSNLCNLLDYQKLFGNIEGQILDSYGKLKAVLIRIQNQLTTICVLPGAPLNVPIREPTAVDANVVVNYFKNAPHSATYEDGRGIGFWYSAFDYKMAFFVRTKPWDPKEFGLLEGNPDPLAQNYNIVAEYKKVERTARILYQLIEWIYTVGYVEFGKSWRTQFSALLEVAEGPYIFEQIDYILPVVKSYTQAIEWIRSKAPSLIIRGKLRITTSILRNKILEKLREFDKGVDGLIPAIPTEMVQLYDYVTDFKKFRNVILFLSFDEITKWRNTITSKLLNNEIYTEVKSEIWRFNYPVYYKNDRLWMIQNNATHSLEIALYISEYWNKEKINLGYETILTSSSKDYILYNVNIESQLFPVAGNNKSTNHIVQIGENRYSSLLLIL